MTLQIDFDLIDRSRDVVSLVVDIDEEIVRWSVFCSTTIETLHRASTASTYFSWKVVQFIKWHGKDATVHEHM
jgi:hypothetical protein